MAITCRSTPPVLAGQDHGKYLIRRLRSAVAGTWSGLKTPVHICQTGGGGSLSAACRVLHAADSSVWTCHVMHTEAALRRMAQRAERSHRELTRWERKCTTWAFKIKRISFLVVEINSHIIAWILAKFWSSTLTMCGRTRDFYNFTTKPSISFV